MADSGVDRKERWERRFVGSEGVLVENESRSIREGEGGEEVRWSAGDDG